MARASILLLLFCSVSLFAADFGTDIQPILSGKCTTCHGGVKKKSGLSFTGRTSALAEVESGLRAIVPGKPEASELLKRVRSTDPDERMPPEGDPLSEKEIAALEAWIAAGAEWPTHWSFRPIEDPKPPAVQHADWVRNPIDRFVLARLEAVRVPPSPEADKPTLVRRLYLDLLGLPPPLAVIDAFEKNTAPDAWEQLVDEVLRSPHFGERWGRHWLDQARYADSDGYEKDNARPNAWRWRDWVIGSFNRDDPFERFTREQIGGDLLPDATDETRLATAFHRQTLYNREGGVDQEEDRTKRVIDRINTVSAAWLGLTTGCTQCHDHPYDPYSQEEFYRFYAFFNNSNEGTVKLSRSNPEDIRKLEQQLAKAYEQAAPAFEAWVKTEAERLKTVNPVAFHPLKLLGHTSKVGAAFNLEPDGSIFVTGGNSAADTYGLIAETAETEITGFRIEVLTDKRLGSKGPGRTKHGNFVLSEFRVRLGGRKLAFTRAVASYNQKNWVDQFAIDGKPETGWGVGGQPGKPQHLTFHLDQPLRFTGPAKLNIDIEQNYGTAHTIGRFKLHAMTGEDEARMPEKLRKALAGAEPLKDEGLRKHFLEQAHAPTRKLREQLDKLRGNALPVRVMTSAARPTYVFHRGDFLQPDKERAVKPGTQSVLHALTPRAEQADRLDLAGWLVDTENPLTARVRANKIWAHLFGEGLVRTMDDFGTRGALPSHPALLDWLATRYRENDWSRKALIRTIVNSATWRQSSVHRPALKQVDPDNELLHRQNRVRVEAEIVRDLYLSVSGLLSPKIGGPSVFPPLPPEVSKQSYANNFKYKTSTGEDRYRRGMYSFFKRTAPDPNLIMFDCPDANVTNTERNRSNTPIQALATLHNEVFVEAAQAFAKRVLEHEGDDAARMDQAIRWCFGRKADAVERNELLGLLKASRAWYADNAEAAAKLGGKHHPEGVAAEEAASWVATLRMLLNTDEFITRS